jgi:hypothetical protein
MPLQAPKNQPFAYQYIDCDSDTVILEPIGTIQKIKHNAWLGVLVFTLFLLPLFVLPTSLLTVGIIVSFQQFDVRGMPLTMTVYGVYLIMTVGFLWLFWHALSTSGYTIYRCEKRDQRLVLQTQNLLGRRHKQVIPFDRIQRLYLRNCRDGELPKPGSSYLMMHYGEYNFLGITHPKELQLSGMMGDRTIVDANAPELLYHQELLTKLQQIFGCAIGDS